MTLRIDCIITYISLALSLSIILALITGYIIKFTMYVSDAGLWNRTDHI